MRLRLCCRVAAARGFAVNIIFIYWRDDARFRARRYFTGRVTESHGSQHTSKVASFFMRAMMGSARQDCMRARRALRRRHGRRSGRFTSIRLSFYVRRFQCRIRATPSIPPPRRRGQPRSFADEGAAQDADMFIFRGAHKSHILQQTRMTSSGGNGVGSLYFWLKEFQTLPASASTAITAYSMSGWSHTGRRCQPANFSCLSGVPITWLSIFKELHGDDSFRCYVGMISMTGHCKKPRDALASRRRFTMPLFTMPPRFLEAPTRASIYFGAIYQVRHLISALIGGSARRQDKRKQ